MYCLQMCAFKGGVRILGHLWCFSQIDCWVGWRLKMLIFRDQLGVQLSIDLCVHLDAQPNIQISNPTPTPNRLTIIHFIHQNYPPKIQFFPMNNQHKYQTIIITGCNRGLGYHLLMTVITKNPNLQIIGTVRNHKNKLKQQLDQDYPANNVTIMQLDIGKSQSIIEFVRNVKMGFKSVDVLVNNAAVMYDSLFEKKVLDEKSAMDTFEINLFGTIELTNQVLPLLTSNARIINVSSKLGALNFQGPKIHQIFNDHNLSMQTIHEAVTEYINGCKQGKLDQYFTSVYGTSKMMLNAWSRFILQKQLQKDQIAICMSPGHCKTDMGGVTANRSPQQGALSIYILLWYDCSSDIFYHCTGQSDYERCG